MHPIEFQHVWKRYQVGGQQDSLRDTIPRLLKRLVGRNGHASDVGKFWALEDVSLEVTQGETLGIIGPNGAGKSTILKLLSKITRQTTGDIAVRGRLAALIEVGAGFHPDLTGRENIYLNGTIMGLKHKQIDRLFDAIVAFAELEKFLDMPVKRYSSGMNVRLGFSIAAHVQPEIMLIDEVLAVGDLAFQQKCYQRLLELKASGTTSIFISHNLEAVQRLCDRAILLQEGRVVMDATPLEAIGYYRKDATLKNRTERVWTPLGVVDSNIAKDAALTEAQLLNAGRQLQETFETGEALNIRLRYRVNRPIRNPSITLTIERIDGLICHEASTQASGLTWPAWEGTGGLTLEYPELNLLPNTYHVSAALYEDQNPAPIARLAEPVYFHVTSTLNSRGTVHLDHAWTLEAQ